MSTSQSKSGAVDEAIKEAAGLLLPLYAASEDCPENILGSYPRPARIVEALKLLIDVVFPGKMTPDHVELKNLGDYLRSHLKKSCELLAPEIQRAIPFRWMGEAARVEGKTLHYDVAGETERIIRAFCARLPDVRSLIIEDVKAAYEGDPAALTYAEVQLAYPGLLAVASHRLAHEFYKLDVPIVPRIMSEWTHSTTGVDIHPGAQIGHGFFIDHATGVVVGETTIIGNRVKVYQGVTLGAKSFPLDEHGFPVKHVKRHPTVEDDVVIYANATILGGDTVIGRGSTIGGNVFLMETVPPSSFVAAKHPELHIKQSAEKRDHR